jgi:hypothetical protein
MKENRGDRQMRINTVGQQVIEKSRLISRFKEKKTRAKYFLLLKIHFLTRSCLKITNKEIGAF